MGEQDLILVIVIIFLAAVAIFLGLTIAAMPPEEGFSELYFATEPPLAGEPDEQTYFSFGIRNLEAGDKSYDYEVLLGGRVVDEGRISIARGQSGIISSSFTIEESAKEAPIKLSVRLMGSGQEIHSWVMPE